MSPFIGMTKRERAAGGRRGQGSALRVLRADTGIAFERSWCSSTHNVFLPSAAPSGPLAFYQSTQRSSERGLHFGTNWCAQNQITPKRTQPRHALPGLFVQGVGCLTVVRQGTAECCRNPTVRSTGSSSTKPSQGLGADDHRPVESRPDRSTRQRPVGWRYSLSPPVFARLCQRLSSSASRSADRPGRVRPRSSGTPN